MGYANFINHVLDNTGTQLINMTQAQIERCITLIYDFKHAIYHKEVHLENWEELTKERRKEMVIAADSRLENNYAAIETLKNIIGDLGPTEAQKKRIAKEEYGGPDWTAARNRCDCNQSSS